MFALLPGAASEIMNPIIATTAAGNISHELIIKGDNCSPVNALVSMVNLTSRWTVSLL